MGERGKYTLFLLFFADRSEKGQKTRSCEEMRIHFFTAPSSYVSRHTSYAFGNQFFQIDLEISKPVMGFKCFS